MLDPSKHTTFTLTLTHAHSHTYSQSLTHAHTLALTPAHIGVVIAADWLSGGDRLVSGSWDHTVRLAATDTGRSIFDANIGTEFVHVCVSMCPGHKTAHLPTNILFVTLYYRFVLCSPSSYLSFISFFSPVRFFSFFFPPLQALTLPATTWQTSPLRTIWCHHSLSAPRATVASACGTSERTSLSCLSLLRTPSTLQHSTILTLLFLFPALIVCPSSSLPHVHYFSPVRSSVTSASFAVDDNIVVTGSDDRSVKVCRTSTCTLT